MPVARPEKVKRNRKELIVDPTRIKGKRSHHKEQITICVDIWKHSFSLRVFNQPDRESQNNPAMPNVSEHYTK